jgi:hypothetical protein
MIGTFVPSMNVCVSFGAEPRTTSCPPNGGGRAMPGRFCTAFSASPFVPGLEKISSREIVRFVTSRGGRCATTRTSSIGSPSFPAGGAAASTAESRSTISVSSPGASVSSTSLGALRAASTWTCAGPCGSPSMRNVPSAPVVVRCSFPDASRTTIVAPATGVSVAIRTIRPTTRAAGGANV